MDSAGALVALVTKVQPAKLLPSNNSILPVGTMAGGLVWENAGPTTAQRNNNDIFRSKDFMRKV